MNRAHRKSVNVGATTSSAFTLVELVVIVLVVAVVLILLLPAFHSTVPRKRHASCLSNMKQIGLAIRLYSADHKEQFPCDPEGTTLVSLALLTNKYQTAYKTWVCPVDKDVFSGTPKRAWTAKNLSYAYGGFGLSETAQPDTPIAADRSSSRVGVWGNVTSPYVGNRWTHKSDGGNVLFADGHVAFQRGFVPPMYRGKNP